MNGDDPNIHVAESFHALASKLSTAGIDERAYAAERDARLALMKAENPNAVTLSEIAGDESIDKQLEQLDRDYARMKRESEAAAKEKQDAQTALADNKFPAPIIKEQ